jgi:hypothetical protein
VLFFRDSSDKSQALLFNHSTHTIGTRRPVCARRRFTDWPRRNWKLNSAQPCVFLEGASGSTHNLALSGDEMTTRIKQTVKEAVAKAQPRPVNRLAASKRPFQFKVRTFDEAKEDEAVTRYCRKYVGAYGDKVIEVFRDMRKTLAPQQGQERETWIQVLLIGDVAIVGVPAEFFTKLGLDIKNRSRSVTRMSPNCQRLDRFTCPTSTRIS